MGRRRKRSNSDVDDSLEKDYGRRGGYDPVENKRVKRDSDNDSGNKKGATAEGSLEVSQNAVIKNKIASDAEKIEALRKKKKERKALKKAKQAEKKQEAEAQLKKKQEEEKAKKKEELRKAMQEKTMEEKSKQSFITTRMGVKYQDIIVGKGPLVKDRKKIRVAYTLRAKTRYGKVLDSSDDFGFRLGRGEVIEGWDIGVKGMRQGGKRYLIIPPAAGYGNKNIGAGKGGILFFEVSVLAC